MFEHVTVEFVSLVEDRRAIPTLVASLRGGWIWRAWQGVVEFGVEMHAVVISHGGLDGKESEVVVEVVYVEVGWVVEDFPVEFYPWRGRAFGRHF